MIASCRADAGGSGARNIKKWLAGRKLLPAEPAAIDAAVEVASLRAGAGSVALHPDLVRLAVRIGEVGAPDPKR